MVNDTRADYDHLMVESDEALCASVRAGNRLAEEVLAARYHRLVRSCARPYFLAGGDSEDLIQEGMFGLIRSRRLILHLCRDLHPPSALLGFEGGDLRETRTIEPRSSP